MGHGLARHDVQKLAQPPLSAFGRWVATLGGAELTALYIGFANRP